MPNLFTGIFLVLVAFGLFAWFDDQSPDSCQIHLKAFDTETTSV